MMLINANLFIHLIDCQPRVGWEGFPREVRSLLGPETRRRWRRRSGGRSQKLPLLSATGQAPVQQFTVY